MTDNHYDIIIVGAGFAGVTAARNLSQKGYRTIVLEGRDRIGGRTWYERRLGKDLELGGTFIHWFQPHVWHETMRYNLEVERLIDIHEAYWISGGEVHTGTEDDEFARMKQGMRLLAKDAEKYFPRPYDPFYNEEAVKEIDHLSLADGLEDIKADVGQEIYDVLVAYWCAYFSTDDLEIPALTQMYRWIAMSFNEWQVMEDIFELYKLKNGTKSLLESMLNDGRAELRLSTPVTHIAKTDSGHSVTTRNGEEFTANAVITAIPLNTLNEIEFSPALAPEKHQFAEEKQTSVNGAKLWAKVRGPGITDTFRLTGPAYPVCSMHTQFFDHETNEAIVMAYVANAQKLDVEDAEAVQELLRKWLPELEVLESTGHNWSQDEFSMGSWCVLRTNQLTKYGKAVRQSEDGLYLAGSDYADGWAGFIDGAIESGSSTGEKVDAYLQEKVHQ